MLRDHAEAVLLDVLGAGKRHGQHTEKRIQNAEAQHDKNQIDEHCSNTVFLFH